MGKGGGKTVTTQGFDQGYGQFRDQGLDAARHYAGQALPGVDPATGQAISQYGNYAQMGQQGAAALGGDPAAIARLMNPYQSQVLGGLDQQYARLRGQTTNDLNAQATAAGAFGGSRHGIAQGVALGQLGQGQMQQAGQLLYQGYGDAMGRAGQLANLGLGATGQMAQLGDYRRQVAMGQQSHAFDTYAAGARAFPYGQTTTQQQPGGNTLGGIVGGLGTIAGMFPGIGTAVGAGLGLLGGGLSRQAGGVNIPQVDINTPPPNFWGR